MKNKIQDLAYFGGQMAFDTPLHVGRPNIGNRNYFLNQVKDILDSRWLTNHGPKVHEFEKDIQDYLGVKHCITVSNATVGLELATRALGLKGEVIVPAFTFVATPHALSWVGVEPVFCDINPQTHNLDPNFVRKLITPNTTGILGVHTWGRPCAIEALTEIADEYGLALYFDAAHAFGCSHNQKMIGNFGELEVFSFHATKFFNTLEGGAITTNNDDLAFRIRKMSNFGFTDYDTVSYLGTNAKMNEVSAAMGLTGLRSLDEFITTNYRNYQIYADLFASLDGIRLISLSENERNNYQYVVAVVDEEKTHISRDAINELLHAENVLTRRYFYPGCHKMEPYRVEQRVVLPKTEYLTTRVLQFPTGTEITQSDIEKIVELLRFIISSAQEIKAYLD